MIQKLRVCLIGGLCLVVGFVLGTTTYRGYKTTYRDYKKSLEEKLSSLPGVKVEDIGWAKRYTLDTAHQIQGTPYNSEWINMDNDQTLEYVRDIPSLGKVEIYDIKEDTKNLGK